MFGWPSTVSTGVPYLADQNQLANRHSQEYCWTGNEFIYFASLHHFNRSVLRP